MASTLKKIGSVLLSIILLVAGYFASEYLPGYMKANEEYKELISYHFMDFGTTLQAFHGELGKLLEDESASNLNRTTIEHLKLDESSLKAFARSNFGVSSLTSGPINCAYTFMLTDTEGVIEQICADQKLVPSERRYIEALYKYTGELIQLHDQKLGPCKGDPANVYTVYSDFSKLADEKLNLTDYAFLKTYQGDFADANFEQAQMTCNTLFSKLVPGQTLKYDNRDDIHARLFEFRTHEELSDPFSMTTMDDIEEKQYTVTYDKADGKIEFFVSSFSTPPESKSLSDQALDDMAKNTIKSIDSNATLEKRTVRNFAKEDKSYSVNYIFTNGIELELESHGLVSRLKLSKWEGK